MRRVVAVALRDGALLDGPAAAAVVALEPVLNRDRAPHRVAVDAVRVEARRVRRRQDRPLAAERVEHQRRRVVLGLGQLRRQRLALLLAVAAAIAAAAAEAPTDDAAESLSVTTLADGAHLTLKPSGRFWELEGGEAASPTAPLLGGGDDDDDGKKVYAVGALPPHLRVAAVGASSGDGATLASVRLADLASFGESLLHQARALPASDAAAAAGVGDPAGGGDARAGDGDAATVVEEVAAEGLGLFRLYGDGRVAASFEDRTLVSMRRPKDIVGTRGGGYALDLEREATAQSRAHLEIRAAAHGGGWYVADVVFPDGTTNQVRSDRPVGCEVYVTAACQFAAWAQKTPEQRVHDAAAVAGEQLQLSAELLRIERHLYVSDRGGGHSIGPPGAVGGAVGGAAELAAARQRVEDELAKLESVLAGGDPFTPPRPPAGGVDGSPQSIWEVAVERYSRSHIDDELERIAQFLTVGTLGGPTATE